MNILHISQKMCISYLQNGIIIRILLASSITRPNNLNLSQMKRAKCIYFENYGWHSWCTIVDLHLITRFAFCANESTLLNWIGGQKDTHARHISNNVHKFYIAWREKKTAETMLHVLLSQCVPVSGQSSSSTWTIIMRSYWNKRMQRWKEVLWINWNIRVYSGYRYENCYKDRWSVAAHLIIIVWENWRWRTHNEIIPPTKW